MIYWYNEKPKGVKKTVIFCCISGWDNLNYLLKTSRDKQVSWPSAVVSVFSFLDEEQEKWGDASVGSFFDVGSVCPGR